MHEHGAHSGSSKSFSPWEQWTPETDIFFYDRVARGIKDKSLTIDRAAAIVLQLLTKSNEIALGLLQELEYVDSPWAFTINTQALVTAQQCISEACDFLTKTDGAESIGSLMVRMHYSIVRKCSTAMLSLNTFYDRLDMWLCVRDEKCLHVTQMLMNITGAVGAMQLCHISTHPDEYVASNEKELEEYLERARQALRIATNALNAVRIPKIGDEKICAEKLALITNASILVVTLKLLEIAARRAFSKNTHSVNMLYVYTCVKEMRHLCGLRITILRSKASEYLDIDRKTTLSTAVWALDRLDDAVDAISLGTYARTGKCLNYTEDLQADIAECMTILTLLRAAHRHNRKQNSDIAKALKENRRIVRNAGLLCTRIRYNYTNRLSDSRGARRLYDLLAYLEHVHKNLTSIDKRQLRYPLWSSSMLEQASAAIERACGICVAELKNADAFIASNINGDGPQSELFSVVNMLFGLSPHAERHVHEGVNTCLARHTCRDNMPGRHMEYSYRGGEFRSPRRASF
ncbi:hypothetical protein [Candidatus Anaplasma sp. TIGMIC]|uniref:hypothetical protein n=1 Tax=Candidatus Anaplasma sp. TIGMIC TaxID=3020713 RepID=UPI00232C6FC9|nr:hypothetical protein [Candidatus Anaplasma sp. TIGMIC]MDB1135175.1 hypothetical protein [Candidatus Anaplasma sp. TIGMIC]